MSFRGRIAAASATRPESDRIAPAVVTSDRSPARGRRAEGGANGSPPGLELFEGSSGTGQREAWRRFLHGSVSPLGEIVAEELAAKLDTPELKLSFDRLYASDLMGRARAFGSLVKAGMEKDRAAELAGLD